MLQSKFFSFTQKNAPKDEISINAQLLIRAGFIDKVITGVYTYLPFGLRVLEKIENIIREEMINIGGQELYLPVLQDKKLWIETDRWNKIDPPLFKFKDRHKKEIALGPTHEEEITDIVRKRVKSYQNLPFSLFQIQTKFRNEMRATAGLLRTREFLMKDLYSFHIDNEDRKKFYQKVKKSYFKIFKKCGLNVICVEASSGTIGGSSSEEFMIESGTGEDIILICKKCGYGANIEKNKKKECLKCKNILEEKKTIEIGHIFDLGTKYSKSMGAKFHDKDGKEKLISMGCYGIGLGRLMGAIVETNHDEKGIIWPIASAPFTVHLLKIKNQKSKIKSIDKFTDEIYKDLQQANIEVLCDDRENISAGEKFTDADLIGIPYRVIISEKTVKQEKIEIKRRDSEKIKLVDKKELLKILC